MSGRIRRVGAAAERVQRLKLPKSVRERFGPYRERPGDFVREVLGAESATRRATGEAYQIAVLEDVARYPMVGVRSGHGIGKTTIDAWAVLWWLVTRPMSRVVVLAPEYSRQIRAVLFSEVRRWARRARVKLPVEVLANRVLVEGFGEEWSATGMSTSGDPARLEGFHGDAVLVVFDEVKAIPQDAFDAVMGATTGYDEARVLVTSVPGGAGAGPFWKVCQDASWHIHHIASTDSSLVSPAWCEQRAKDWGFGSPLYTCRVLGDFADAGEGVLFPLGLLDAAMNRPASELKTAGLGVDVARSIAGDLNVIAMCRSGRLEVLKTWRSPDTMETTAKVEHAVAETGIRGLAVDTGGPGGGVVDRLRQLGYTTRGVAFGGGAHDPTRFRNARAELFWNLRTALETGVVALADDDEVRADLSAIRYVFAQDGRIQIEGKDEVRKRLGRSPDRGDALALALSVCYGRAQAVPLVGPVTVVGPGRWSGAYEETGTDPRTYSPFFDAPDHGGRRWPS